MLRQIKRSQYYCRRFSEKFIGMDFCLVRVHNTLVVIVGAVGAPPALMSLSSPLGLPPPCPWPGPHIRTSLQIPKALPYQRAHVPTQPWPVPVPREVPSAGDWGSGMGPACPDRPQSPWGPGGYKS